MAADRVPPATESINLPKPSIAPAFFAFGLVLATAGLYLVFMGPSWAYVVIGLVIALTALVSMVRQSVRSFFRLPRKQELTSSPLPVDAVEAPERRRPPA